GRKRRRDSFRLPGAAARAPAGADAGRVAGVARRVGGDGQPGGGAGGPDAVAAAGDPGAVPDPADVPRREAAGRAARALPPRRPGVQAPAVVSGGHREAAAVDLRARPCRLTVKPALVPVFLLTSFLRNKK